VPTDVTFDDASLRLSPCVTPISDVGNPPTVVGLMLATRHSAECRLRVTGCSPDGVSGTTGVPQIADHLLHGTMSSPLGHQETFQTLPYTRKLVFDLPS
jgi:hypothetical protein